MRFAILGAGAIGAYVGAALVRGGSEVTLIARGEHLRALRERGVRVLSPRGDFAAHPKATDEIGAVAEADAVFVALKAYSLPEVAPRLAAALGPETAVIAAPGVVRHVEGTRFSIGEPDGTLSERCGRISQAFAAGGLKCPVERELRRELWLKLVGNAAFNPVTALTGATLGELGSLPEMVALLRSILEEGAAVAAALGIELPVSLERRLEAGIAVGDHRTSMLEDLEAGKPLEFECMTGAVVELAELLGIPVPHTRAVHACVKLLDALRRRAGDAAGPRPAAASRI